MHKILRNGVWFRMQNIFKKSIILEQLKFKTKIPRGANYKRDSTSKMRENDYQEAIKL